jgi:hypothetical protein
MVIAIYHPYWGNSSQHSLMIDNLLDTVSHGRQSHSIKNVLICGDFNGLSDSVVTMNALLGTESLFQFPTRGKAQLDFILSDFKNAYGSPILQPPLGRSDHSVIFCPSLKVLPSPKVRKIQFHIKTPNACARFRSLLASSDALPSVLSVTNVNEATRLLLSLLIFLFKECFPLAKDS